MSLEPPTVLTRPPPSTTPDLPPSPAPSSHADVVLNDTPPELTAFALAFRAQQRQHQLGHPSGTSTPAIPCDAPECRDQHGRLKHKKRKAGAGAGMDESRWRALLREWKLLLTLENSGSVARDHLASERTFLAYARTSLTIASTGVALVQLFTLSAATMNEDLERYARPLGATMIALGLLTLTIGVGRYFLIQEALLRGVYPIARVSATMLSFALLSLVLVVFVIILVAK